MDKFVVKGITSTKNAKAKYPQYFSPEIKPFLKEKWFPKYSRGIGFYPPENEWVKEIEQELPDNFFELRKTGENDSYICNLIRNDSIDDFIIYINKINYSLQSIISPSIYETNSFMIKNNNQVTLIDYVAFFGSYQIFKYLQLNKIDLKPKLWNFIIHGKNSDLIHLLEDNKINPCIECLKIAIKCHHNDIAKYLLNTQFYDTNMSSLTIQSLKSYNFEFIQSESIDEDVFLLLCKYNHCWLTKYLFNGANIDINLIIIQKHIFKYNLFVNFSTKFEI